MKAIISPGATIYLLTKYLGGWSWRYLGEKLGGGQLLGRDLLYDMLEITDELAEKLGEVFGDCKVLFDGSIKCNKEFWLNRNKQYQENKNKCFIIGTNFIEDLEQFGFWSEDGGDYQDVLYMKLEKSLKKFEEMSSKKES